MHLVTAELDAGPIIVQAAVPVLPDDTVDALSARILVEEHKLLPAAIQAVLDGRWRVEGRRFVTPADLTVTRAWSVSTATSGGQLMRTGTYDRPQASADEQRALSPCARCPRAPGTCCAATAPTSGSTTCPPCVWPESTSGTSSAAASGAAADRARAE